MNTLSETEKALSNFPFTYHPVSLKLIHTIAEIKYACARANERDNVISPEISNQIQKVCKEIIEGIHDTKFITCALQGGAGTSLHMNVNEVIAQTVGSIQPLDHVNASQSTNDVNPSALRITAYRLIHNLQSELSLIQSSLETKAAAWSSVQKLGRTHLQDAVPTTMGRSFEAYASILSHHQQLIKQQTISLLELPLGGTAIGTSINASPSYKRYVYEELQHLTHLPVSPLNDPMSGIQSQTKFLSIQQCIVSMYVDLSKIANDIRLLSSGPHGGLGELILPSLQKGSTIMPGKSNPIMCEVVNQTYFLISGYQTTIEKACEASQLELGVMFPIIADTLIQSLILSQEVLTQFRTQCIDILEINEKQCLYFLEHSHAYAVILTPVLGYEQVHACVEEANLTHTSFIEVLKQRHLYTEEIQQLLINSTNHPLD